MIFISRHKNLPQMPSWHFSSAAVAPTKLLLKVGSYKISDSWDKSVRISSENGLKTKNMKMGPNSYKNFLPALNPFLKISSQLPVTFPHMIGEGLTH